MIIRKGFTTRHIFHYDTKQVTLMDFLWSSMTFRFSTGENGQVNEGDDKK